MGSDGQPPKGTENPTEESSTAVPKHNQTAFHSMEYKVSVCRVCVCVCVCDELVRLAFPFVCVSVCVCVLSTDPSRGHRCRCPAVVMTFL